jgi:sulfatase-like protein
LKASDLSRWLRGSAPVNTVTLAGLLALLVAVHEWLLSGVSTATAQQEAYLQLVSLTQCLFVTESAAVGILLAGRLRHVVFGLSLTMAPLLYVDALVRTRVDRSLASVAGLLFDAHLADNRKVLEATGVDGRAVGAFALALGVLVTLGAWVDRRTRVTAARAPHGSRGALVSAWLLTAVALAALEAGAGVAVRAASWSRFARCVPQLLEGFAPTAKAKATLRVRLRPPRSAAALAEAIARVDLPRTPPPGDVFLFVVDSLRADAVDPTTAPALFALSHEALHADTAVSGGDMTHYGWYALFRAEPALYWRLDPDADDRDGAVPLRIARRRGWRIEVLSSPDPAYMRLDQSILGADRQLADALLDLHDAPGTAGDHDAAVVDELAARIGRPHPPTAYLVFLDAVHMPYLWAGGFEPPFLPYADASHYMRVQRAGTDRLAVKNRYRNAVAFVDSLVAHFLATLRAAGRYPEATIVVVGDHGEEHWEHGLTGHGSEPCSAQTHVALLLKLPRSSLGEGDWSSPKKLASTMDVWPTILDAAGVRAVGVSLFDGTSLVRGHPHASLTAHTRYLYPPARFVLDDGDEKVVFELSQPDSPFREQDLYVVDVLDENDAQTHPDLTPSQYAALVRGWFGSDLERFFAVRW